MSTGKTIELEVYHPCTTERVKQVISSVEGMHPFCLQLAFNGRVLEDRHTVSNYNVREGSTLDLVIKPGSKYMY